MYDRANHRKSRTSTWPHKQTTNSQKQYVHHLSVEACGMHGRAYTAFRLVGLMVRVHSGLVKLLGIQKPLSSFALPLVHGLDGLHLQHGLMLHYTATVPEAGSSTCKDVSRTCAIWPSCKTLPVCMLQWTKIYITSRITVCWGIKHVHAAQGPVKPIQAWTAGHAQPARMLSTIDEQNLWRFEHCCAMPVRHDIFAALA